MIISAGYHEYIGGCSVHQGISCCMWRDIMSTSRNIMMHVRGYHKYIRGCSVLQGCT